MLRFWCLEHDEALQVDELEQTYEGIIDEPVLYASGDGTYEFSFRSMRCLSSDRRLNQMFWDMQEQLTDAERDALYEKEVNHCLKHWQVLFKPSVPQAWTRVG